MSLTPERLKKACPLPASWDEQRAQWELSGKIVRTLNITRTAEGPDDGKWVSCVVAAVLLP